MNNYQVQQMFNDLNGIIGFAISVMVIGFVVGMTKLTGGIGILPKQRYDISGCDFIRGEIYV